MQMSCKPKKLHDLWGAPEKDGLLHYISALGRRRVCVTRPEFPKLGLQRGHPQAYLGIGCSQWLAVCKQHMCAVAACTWVEVGVCVCLSRSVCFPCVCSSCHCFKATSFRIIRRPSASLSTSSYSFCYH